MHLTWTLDRYVCWDLSINYYSELMVMTYNLERILFIYYSGTLAYVSTYMFSSIILYWNLCKLK